MTESLSTTEFDNRLRTAVGQLHERLDEPPRAAVVLGTGLHGLASEIESATRIPYHSLSGFVKATADGHVGEFVGGRWRGTPILAMNGRFHFYEGYRFDQVTWPIRVMAGLGIRSLILSNAAGGLNPGFRAGQVMLIDDHIDLTFGLASRQGGRSCRGSDVAELRGSTSEIYSRQWLDQVQEPPSPAAGLRRGVYVGLSGPTYETRAEYRCLRRIGGDAVGMSTVSEARIAVELGMHVFGMSVITNVANPDAPSKTTSDEVIETAGGSGGEVREVLESALACIRDTRSP